MESSSFIWKVGGREKSNKGNTQFFSVYWCWSNNFCKIVGREHAIVNVVVDLVTGLVRVTLRVIIEILIGDVDVKNIAVAVLG